MQAGFDDAALSYISPEHKDLHTHKGVVKDYSGAVDLCLVSERHSASYINGVLSAVDFIKVFFRQVHCETRSSGHG